MPSAFVLDADIDTFPKLLARNAVKFRGKSAYREKEYGIWQSWTWDEVKDEVEALAMGMLALGLNPGDHVAIIGRNRPYLYWAMTATQCCGAIPVPVYNDANAEEMSYVLDHCGARFLVVEDQEQVDKVLEIQDQLPNIAEIIYLDKRGMRKYDHTHLNAYVDVQAEGRAGRARLAPIMIERQNATTANSTSVMLYTSGTTGRPKGAVHTHIGFPIKAATDMAMGLDLRREDTLYWMTDMGWMMGPWEVFGALILGATMVFYDGAPDYPDVDRLWKLVADHGITHLGVSPTLIRALMAHGEEPVKRYDLSKLRAFGSTGEPWNPDPWMWLFQVVGEGKRPIINYSGGTEISGGIVMGNVVKPLKPAAFSGPNVDMAADVVDDDGNPVRGQVGELVIRQPWIGMTRGFWKDPDRYIETYWSRFPDTWVHGDFAAIDKDGQWYILGRSDDTIKVAGKRLGPAEVESILVKHPAVLEAGAIGVPHAIKGSALVVAVVLSPGHEPSDELAEELKAMVVAGMGKALKPQDIFFAPDLPKTRNAKVMRRVLRAAYLDLPAGDLSALVNPDVVEEIRVIGKERRAQ
jgi:acetyl-CoA synthetase